MFRHIPKNGVTKFQNITKKGRRGKKQVIHKKLTIRVATSQQQGWKLEIVDFWTM